MEELVCFQMVVTNKMIVTVWISTWTWQCDIFFVFVVCVCDDFISFIKKTTKVDMIQL